MAVAAINSDKVVDRLNDIESLGMPSDIEMQRLKRDIDSIKGSAPAIHFMLMGMFHSVKGDYESAVSFHEKSLRLSSETFLFVNYGTSLRRLGKSSEGLDKLLIAFKREPNSVVIARELIDAILSSGRLSELDAVLEKFQAANPEFDVAQFEQVGMINKVREMIARAGIPEAEYSSAVQEIEALGRACGTPIKSFMAESSSFDGVVHVATYFGVQAPNHELLAELNDKIAEIMISRDFTAWDRMIFTAVEDLKPQAC